MGEFLRERLPDPVEFFEGEGVKLIGRGKWRSAICTFHEDSSPSMRINTESGGWCCMACGIKGGDVLAFVMQRDGLEFVEAARALGAYVDDGKEHRGSDRAMMLSPRAAMEVVAQELGIAMVVMSSFRRGLPVSDADWCRFVDCVGRVEWLAGEYV